jgi:nucleoid DNA-binding protein
MQGPVTKSDVIARVAEATGLTKMETEAVLDGFIVTIVHALKEQEPVELRGFGAFRVQHRPTRTARNPRTGEEVTVGERFVPVFKVSRELSREIDSSIRKP